MLEKVLAAAIITYAIIEATASFAPNSADAMLILMIPLVCLAIACTDAIIKTIKEYSTSIIQVIEENSNKTNDKD